MRCPVVVVVATAVVARPMRRTAVRVLHLVIGVVVPCTTVWLGRRTRERHSHSCHRPDSAIPNVHPFVVSSNVDHNNNTVVVAVALVVVDSDDAPTSAVVVVPDPTRAFRQVRVPGCWAIVGVVVAAVPGANPSIHLPVTKK